MRLFLARHGETDWNLLSKIQGQTDTVLNTTGHVQANELADKLVNDNYHIDCIYSSRQKRALETAQIVGERLNLTPVVVDGLEEMSLGNWEGYTWPQVKEQFTEDYLTWHSNRRYISTPEGESYQQVLDRVLPVLRMIIEKETGNVLVLTHSAIIMSLMSYIHNTPFEQMAKNYRTANADILELTAEDRDKL